MTSHKGPNLPYSVIAGATPVNNGWLVASAKLHGATFAPEEVRVLDTFREVLDIRPTLSALVVNAPIGLVDSLSEEQRICDREARSLLGTGATMLREAPSRDRLHAAKARVESSSLADHELLLSRYLELSGEMSPYRQRVVYEGHPELSYFQLNGDESLVTSPDSEEGLEERRNILVRKIPGVGRLFESGQVDAPLREVYAVAALLWTARRVFGHSARRLPEDAVWDSEGLRMELVL